MVLLFYQQKPAIASHAHKGNVILAASPWIYFLPFLLRSCSLLIIPMVQLASMLNVKRTAKYGREKEQPGYSDKLLVRIGNNWDIPLEF